MPSGKKSLGKVTPTIKVPHLCVAGEAEELSPLEHSERLMAALQGSEADGGVPGIAPFGRQRSGRRSRAVSADPGRRLIVDRLAGKPLVSERWYVTGSGEINKTPY